MLFSLCYLFGNGVSTGMTHTYKSHNGGAKRKIRAPHTHMTCTQKAKIVFELTHRLRALKGFYEPCLTSLFGYRI